MQGDIALNFDFSQIDPNWSGGAFLPVSDAKGWLVILNGSAGWKPAKSGEGNYLELTGIGQDQAVANQEFVIRLNLQHTKPSAVNAAYAQLSALGHVMGLPGRIGNLSELFNKPFRIVSEKQKDSDYTQLANNGIRDVNGNAPGKAGAGPQQAAPAPQIPQNNQGGFGGAPQGQGQGQPQQFGNPGNFTVPQQFTGTGQAVQAFDPGNGQAPFAVQGQGQGGGFQQGAPLNQGQGQNSGPAFGGPQNGPAFGQGQGQPQFGGNQGQPQFGQAQGGPSWAK